MTKRIFAICYLLTLLLIEAGAQAKFPGCTPGYCLTSPEAFVNVPSPGAASLETYGDIGISYYTGRANVCVPLYEMEVRGKTLPITLEYESSGIRVNCLPSWSGQNWTLNAGGVITRTEKGAYDEWTPPEQMYVKFDNYFKCHDKIKEFTTKNDNYKALKENLMYGYYDLAPDEYSFSFLDKHGKFFLDENGNWRVMSDGNLEVIFDYNDPSNFVSPLFSKFPYRTAIEKEQCKTIAGFVIRDDDGYCYTFGYDRNAIEFTTNMWYMSKDEQTQSWRAMSWFLTKITDKYGNLLFSFDYDRSAYVIQVFNSYYADKEDQNASGMLGAGQTRVVSNSDFPFTMSISSPVYLKKITAMNGITADFYSIYVGDDMAADRLYSSLIKRYGTTSWLYAAMAKNVPVWRPTSYGTYPLGAFYYVNGTESIDERPNDSIAKFRYNPKNPDQLNILSYTRLRQLKTISITTPKGHDFIGFRFHHSYVQNRLRLDSLQIQDGAINYTPLTGTKGMYRFEYDDFESLPSDYLTAQADHWGYFNGKPYMNVSGGLVEDNLESVRNPDFLYTKKGTLKALQYPTGGVSVFEYEPNAYGKKLSLDRQSLIDESGIGGGLRIKSIKNYESPALDNLLSQKSYCYESQDGKSSSGILYQAPLYNWDGWRVKCENKNATYRLTTRHAASVVPLVNSLGASVSYGNVTESTMDALGNCIEKRAFEFSDVSDHSARDEKFWFTFGYNDGKTPYDEYSEHDFMRGKLLKETVWDKYGNKTRAIGYMYRKDECLAGNSVMTSNLRYVCQGNSTQYLHYTGGIYKLYYPKYDLVETQDTMFSDNLPSMVTIHKYGKEDKEYTSWHPYRHGNKIRLTAYETITRGPAIERNDYHFGNFNDSNGNDSILYKAMSSIKPLYISYSRNSTHLYDTHTEYRMFSINGKPLLAPSKIIQEYNNGEKDTLSEYTYTNTGQIKSYKELGKPKLLYKWAVKDNYLMTESYTDMPFSISDSDFYDLDKCREKSRRYLGSLSFFKFFLYNPLFGPVEMAEPNGNITYYEYDSFGRIVKIRDSNGNITKAYEYNIRK